jgi:feruloyl esterase
MSWVDLSSLLSSRRLSRGGLGVRHVSARSAAVILATILTTLCSCFAPSASAATCESLRGSTVPNGTVTLATTVAPGAFVSPVGRAGGPGGADPFARLAAFCRVAITLTPTRRSDVKAEVWLPASDWNGKLQVVGNGGFAGTISYAAMASALAAGYATASTDTGHAGPASNTFVNDDVTVDFAHRAIHETAVAAKRVVDGFYGMAPTFSYFAGCSTGGRQALTAAQRYPDDFNGIVAGAPASYTSKQAFGQIWIYQATATPASAIPREKLSVLHNAVLAACDGHDGVKDGVLENPRACTFDPAAVACRQGDDPAACLVPPQVDAVRKIYAGPSNPRTREPIFPGLERGSELGWTPTPVSYAVDYFKYVVFKNANWDPMTLNFDSHLAEAARLPNRIFDANDPVLTPFTKRGGKLLMYQGWAEPGIPPGNIVTYLGQAQAKSLNGTDAVRLFMVPGMGHCGGGNGTSTFDMVAALDAWVTKGVAPEQVPASRMRDGKADRTRPLCAWPTVASYTGSGSTDEAKNFVCK